MSVEIPVGLVLKVMGAITLYIHRSSKNALLADRTLLDKQVKELESSNLKHPRLGQWKARLDRLDLILTEILDAESRSAEGEIPSRPRYELVPHDPPFEAPSPQPPLKRSIHTRRREAAKRSAHGPFKRKYDLVPLKELDTATLTRANIILQNIEVTRIPMTIKAFALRLNIDSNTLYNWADIYDRLIRHNEQCLTSLDDIIIIKIEELYVQKKIMEHEEFAEMCGISQGHFFKRYSELSSKLTEQNKQIQRNQVRRSVEQHLQELVTSGIGQSIGHFSKQIGIDIKTLRTQHSDIVKELVEA